MPSEASESFLVGVEFIVTSSTFSIPLVSVGFVEVSGSSVPVNSDIMPTAAKIKNTAAMTINTVFPFLPRLPFEPFCGG